MSEPAIQFFSEKISFVLSEPERIAAWLVNVIHSEKHQLSFLNCIFCDDDYLHTINIEYLQHDTLTDVITFPYHDTQMQLLKAISLSV